MDYVIRYEELELGLRYVSRRLGVEVKLDPVTRDHHREPGWRAYYDFGTYCAVSSWAKADSERWGHQF